MIYRQKESEQKPEASELSLAERILDKGIEWSMYGVALAISVLPTYSLLRSLYDGPVDVPGVQRVIVSPHWFPHDHGFNIAEYAGNTVNVTFSDGLVAKVRDYNGDFVINNEDTVEGAVSKSVLPVLAAAKEKVAWQNARNNPFPLPR